jgi:hypothetical protein
VLLQHGNGAVSSCPTLDARTFGCLLVLMPCCARVSHHSRHIAWQKSQYSLGLLGAAALGVSAVMLKQGSTSTQRLLVLATIEHFW